MRGSVRKVVSFIVLMGVILVGGKFAGLYGTGPVPVEIHYLLGDPPIAAALEVAFVPVGSAEVAARFETHIISRDVAEKTRLPGGEVRLDITLVAASGTRKTVQRTITAERSAVVRLDLSREQVTP